MSQPILTPGTRVQVIEGPFNGMDGTVLELAETFVRVQLTIFGRHVPAEFGWGQLTLDDQPLLPALPPYAPPPPEMTALLQLVLDDPWDDDARSVYADWLEEHDDPHHEYLRVQAAYTKALRERRPFDDLVQREQELRRLLHPEWVARIRRLTTELASVDVGTLVPALAEHARVSIRLHPRQGNVTELNASKFGGLFLWPEEEPWPVIRDFRYSEWYRDHLSNVPLVRQDAPPEGVEVALAPVLQLRACDVPNITFPPGKDLLQLFWCPVWSEENGPVPFLFWRDSQEVTHPRLSPPKLTFREWGLVPVPCRLHCERVVEYPLLCGFPRDDAFPDHGAWMEQLAQSLGSTVKEAEDDYIKRWSVVRGCKVGGYPYGHQWGVPLQGEGGREADFLVSLSAREIDPNHARWCPVEDRNLLEPSQRPHYRSDLTGGFHHFGRGDYFVLLDRGTEPWTVRSYYDYT